jgi:hypothetical protein
LSHTLQFLIEENAPRPAVEVRGRDYVATVTDRRDAKESPSVTLLIRLPREPLAEVVISGDPDIREGHRYDLKELEATFGPSGATRIAKLLWPKASD